MRVIFAVVALAFLAGSAFAQTKPVPKYGDVDPDKTQTELDSERQAERAYKRSLGNVPDAGPVDPWGNVRGSPTPKAAKPAPAKRAADNPQNSSVAK